MYGMILKSAFAFQGLDCCSDNAISFHYINPKMMYVLDYLIYNLMPFGILRSPGRLPKKLGVGEFMPPPDEALGLLDSSKDSMEDGDELVENTTTNSTQTITANEEGEGEVL